MGWKTAPGYPIYVHAKLCIIDDEWAKVGSDNINRRSWTHDSELACAVVDESPEGRPQDGRELICPRTASATGPGTPRPGRWR